MISVQGLTKHYGPVVALDDVSFEVRQGEVLGFLGPNGAGKTTTYKILTGYLTATAGTAVIKDLDIAKNPREIKRLIGYMPQSFPLYNEMMVIDYLDFISRMREIPMSGRRSSLSRVVEICGLGDMLGRNIYELSHGYQQRVGLAQALIHDPPILIMDEPTSGLDPIQIKEIRELIKDIAQEKTIIFSTHILAEAQITCNRFIILSLGSIVAQGTLEELRESYKGPSRIRLTLAKEYERAAEILRTVDFVDDVKREDGSAAEPTFMIEAPRNRDLRSRIMACCQEHGWSVLDQNALPVGLEDIFLKVARSESIRADKAAA